MLVGGWSGGGRDGCGRVLSLSDNKTMMNTWPEQVRFIRSLKGAAASILWVLMLSGRTCTSKELELATNYSDKPVSDGLALLETEGIVQYNGKFNGWSLGPGFYQLPLPFRQLVNGVALLDAGANDGGVIGLEDRNISDLLSSSSSSYTDQNLKIKQEEEEEGRDSRNYSEVLGMLVAAGVAPRSSALLNLMKLNLDPVYVKAHIEHRRTVLEQGNPYPPGWLINKLRCGDPAPAPVRDRLNQQIPDDLRDIIKR